MTKIRKKKSDEPIVLISRKCFACGKSFTLGHPNSPNRLCEDCEKVLGQMIMEHKNDNQS